MSYVGYESVKFCVDYTTDGSSPGHPVIMSLWEKKSNTEIKSNDHSIYTSENLMSLYLTSSKINFKKIEQKVDSIQDNSKIAVWGTGSHTSRLLGMTNLLDKNIVKFYDSNKKKHQFEILNKKITFFDENDIINGVIDTIVISTFSGEKEILKYINSLNVNVNVVALYNN
jgi:hypothetical protein